MKNIKSTTQSSFKVGSKVVCINDDFSNIPSLYRIIFRFPVAGQVYTIRGKIGEKSIWLKEVVNEVVKFPNGPVAEPAFFNWRFRPLCLDEIENTEVKEELLAVNKCLFKNTLRKWI